MKLVNSFRKLTIDVFQFSLPDKTPESDLDETEAEDSTLYNR
jgi:hypothetical protein